MYSRMGARKNMYLYFWRPGSNLVTHGRGGLAYRGGAYGFGSVRGSTKMCTRPAIRTRHKFAARRSHRQIARSSPVPADAVGGLESGAADAGGCPDAESPGSVSSLAWTAHIARRWKPAPIRVRCCSKDEPAADNW